MDNGVPEKYGVLDFTKCKTKEEKISQCKKGIEFVIKATKPEVISIEDIQHQVNLQTFKTLAELKGVLENMVYEKEHLLISGVGKYPGYNYYNVAGVDVGVKPKGEGDQEQKTVNVRDLMP